METHGWPRFHCWLLAPPCGSNFDLLPWPTDSRDYLNWHRFSFFAQTRRISYKSCVPFNEWVIDFCAWSPWRRLLCLLHSLLVWMDVRCPPKRELAPFVSSLVGSSWNRLTHFRSCFTVEMVYLTTFAPFCMQFMHRIRPCSRRGR